MKIYVVLLLWISWGLFVGCTPTTGIASPTQSEPGLDTPTPTNASQPSEGSEDIVTTTPPFETVQVEGTVDLSKSATKDATCPHLDSRLYQLSVASDPEDFARTHNLTYSEGTVQAVMLLKDAEADLDFAKAFGVEIEERYQDQVQIRVPVESLCSLSNHPSVRYVQPPSLPVTDE